MAKHKAGPEAPSIRGQPVTYWLERLNHPKRETVKEAREALTSVSSLTARQKADLGPAVPHLLAAWVNCESSNRFHISWCLRSLDSVVAPYLPAFFDEIQPHLKFCREVAAFLLEQSRTGDRKALPALVHYLETVLEDGYDSPARVLAVDVRHMGERAAPIAPYLAREFDKYFVFAAREIALTLGAIGTGAAGLIRALKHSDSQLRQNAAAALAQIRPAEAVSPLSELLRHPDYPTVAAAAAALGEFGPLAKSAVTDLQRALSSRSKVVREAAKAALQKLPIPETAKTPPKKSRMPPRMARPSADSTGLLQAILDDPHDDTRRLVYADWLEEQGQSERAEYIRVACEWASLPEDDPRREDLLSREQALLSDHKKLWLQEVPAWAAPHCSFERGFVGEIYCTVKAFLKGAAGLFRRAPVVSLRLGSGAGLGQALAECPLLSRVSRLNLGAPEADVRLVLQSPHLANLTSLSLTMCDLSDAALSLLASRPTLARLTELNILGNKFGPEGVRALAQSRHLANLRTLYLGGNQHVGDAGVRHLAASPHLRQLTELGLWVNGITAAGAAVLAQSEVCRTLKNLRLGNNQLGNAGAAALARSPWLGKLVALDLLNSEIGDAGAQAIADSPTLGNLVRLDLPTNAIGPVGAAALANSRQLTKLRKLSLLYNPIQDEGALALARSPLPLTRIEVNVGFSAAATAALNARRAVR